MSDLGFGIFDPLTALESAAGAAWDKVESAVVQWVPGGLAIAATVEAAKVNVADARKDNPDSLGALESGLSKTWTDTGPAVDAAVKPIEDKLKEGLSVLDWLTKPWVLGGIAVVVGLAVVGPYVLPFFPKRG